MPSRDPECGDHATINHRQGIVGAGPPSRRDSAMTHHLLVASMSASLFTSVGAERGILMSTTLCSGLMSGATVVIVMFTFTLSSVGHA
jgi:hypothetical protein